MSNRRKLQPPVGIDKFGRSYLLVRKQRKLQAQVTQEHNRQGNVRAREIAQTAESIGSRLTSGEITPTEAQAELLDKVVTSRKR